MRSFIARSAALIIRASNPAPAITAKCSPFTRARIQRTTFTLQPDPHRLGEIGRNLQVRRKEIRRTGRKDGKDNLRPCHRVDTALDHSVASPYEDHLSALRQRVASVLGCLAALRHLIPKRIGQTLPRQHRPRPRREECPEPVQRPLRLDRGRRLRLPVAAPARATDTKGVVIPSFRPLSTLISRRILAGGQHQEQDGGTPLLY